MPRTEPLWKRSFLVFRMTEARVAITKTRLFKYIENFTTKKGEFHIKKSYIFHIFAPNIDCGYSLEPPHHFFSKHRLWYPLEPPWRGRSKEYPQSIFLSINKNIMYTPINPSFTIQKWGFRQECFRDDFCPMLYMLIWYELLEYSYSSAHVLLNMIKILFL